MPSTRLYIEPDKVAERRLLLGMDQEQLAAKSRVNLATIKNIERAGEPTKRNVSTVAMIARALRCKVPDIAYVDSSEQEEAAS